MLDIMRAWDLVQDNTLFVDPADDIAHVVRHLLGHMGESGPCCAIVRDKQGRYLGTFSTHRALRVIGQALQQKGVFEKNINHVQAMQAVCRLVGTQKVADHTYTKTLQVSPQATMRELLALFAETTAHFAVVMEAGRALGVLELDEIFRVLGQEMIDTLGK